ncbi:MAG: FecR domain-containing protein [Treponema sp.]|nr:FecR domain-containing protein [Treponema sp.]
MKKLILSLIFTAFAFSAFAMQATVVSAKGKAEVQNGSMWVALKPGDTLNQGSVIQTGFKSELVIKIKESTVTVASLSRLTLQTLAEREGLAGAAAKDETSIFLDTGALRSNVKKSADRRVGFTVRSPVATASVRGTGFRFKAQFKSVALSTDSGRVAFWKNTRRSEQALNAAASNAENPAADASEGNEAQDISEYAPQDAIVVSKGEDAAVSESKGLSAPSTVAQAQSNSVGDGTKTAASLERPATDTEAFSTNSLTPGKGSLTIAIGFDEA